MPKKSTKHSLKTRIISILLFSVIVLSVSTGIVSYISVTRLLNANIASRMNLLCEKHCLEIDQQFTQIEDAANNAATYLLNEIQNPKEIKDEETRQRLLDGALKILNSSVLKKESTLAYYVVIPEDMETRKMDGYFYSKTAAGFFIRNPITDLSQYSPDDTEHTGWFYIPVNNGGPLWLTPYHNKNLNTYMVSYEIPVFQRGQLIALLGIDVNFKHLVKLVSKIEFLSNGYAFLKNSDGTIHYHPDFFEEKDIHGDEMDIPLKNGHLLANESSDNKLIHYKFHGRKRVETFGTLKNGMKLVLCDSYFEVYGQSFFLLITLFLIDALLAGLFIWIGIKESNKIINPIEDLIKAAGQISDGSFDVQLPQATDDEIGILTQGFGQTVSHLKTYSQTMETKAYRDSLTKVKNSAALEMEFENLDEMIAAKTVGDFGVIMFDINFLKIINDTYGHKNGDILIQTASSLICKSFPLSNVYRTGGDEFVVLLKGHEYKIREELCENFSHLQKANAESKKPPYEAPSISYGLATYETGDKNCHAVLNRADQLMYEHKKKIHEAKGLKVR